MHTHARVKPCCTIVNCADRAHSSTSSKAKGRLDYVSLRHVPVTNLPRKSGADAIAVKTPSRPSGATDML